MMTSISNKEIISAQVLLLPESKKKIGEQDQITAENLETFALHPDAHVQVSAFFESMHFDVGPLVGFSFSISAPASMFEEIFNIKLQKSKKGGIQCQGGDQKINLYNLSTDVFRFIQEVIFDEPPDFGPMEFYE